jgi:hypothetical protein
MYLGHPGAGASVLLAALIFGILSPGVSLVVWFIALVHAWSVSAEQSEEGHRTELEEGVDSRLLTEESSSEPVHAQSSTSITKVPEDTPPVASRGGVSANAVVRRLVLASRLHGKGLLTSDDFLKQRIRVVTDLALSGPIESPEEYLASLEEMCAGGAIEHSDVRRIKAVLYP